MNNDYICEYLKNSGAIESVSTTCNDKDKSVYNVNVNKCLDKHCKRSNKPRNENGRCPMVKKSIKKKSKNKSRNKSKTSSNRKRAKKKSKNQS